MNQPQPTRRWRLQYSLRTFLIATTLAALAIWGVVSWHKKPSPAETKLPGGLSFWDDAQFEKKVPFAGTTLVGHGRFAITDEFGRVWCRGEYDQGRAVGRWTWYRPDGRAALSGICRDNCRVDGWKLWPESGWASGAMQHAGPLEWRSVNENLAHHFMSIETSVELDSNRQGKAKLLGAGGRAEGSYANDAREGAWTFWNEQGRIAAQGEYRGGLQHGVWTFFDEPQGTPRAAHFASGRELSDVPEKLAQLARDLKSADWETRVEAVEALREYGAEGISLLNSVLAGADSELVIRTLRVVARGSADASEALPQVRRLAESPERAVRVEALLALFVLDAAQRDETCVRLLSPENAAGPAEHGELHERVGRLGLPVLVPLERALNHAETHVRLGAMDVLAYLAFPLPDGAMSGGNWQPPFQQSPGYRAELQRILEQAEHHADPVLAEAAGNILDYLHAHEKPAP